MSEEKKRKKETKTIDNVGLNSKDSAKAAELRFNPEDFDSKKECRFSMEVISNPDNPDICTTRVEMMGNMELFIAAVISSTKNDDRLSWIMNTIGQELMMNSVMESSGMTKEELMEQVMKSKDEEDGSSIIPMGMGADA